MKMIDITMTIDEKMQVYKNKDEKKPEITVTRDFETSDAMETHLSMDMHTGTHLDMPLHFVPDGESLEMLDLNRLITTCRVVDLSYLQDGISREDLMKKDLLDVSFVLLKTRNSLEDEYRSDFIYLKSSGARYLKEIGMDGVGIDALGIERDQPEHETHKILLGNGILILEGLRLADAEEGIYRMIALPMKIKGVEAAPIRVILIQEA